MTKKILLIDDEPMVVKMIENRLKTNGYAVITALNAEDGFKKAIDGKPDLIILDVLMPKTFGNELARQLQDDSRTSRIPVIFLSNVPTEFLSGEEKFSGQAQQVVDGSSNWGEYLGQIDLPEDVVRQAISNGSTLLSADRRDKEEHEKMQEAFKWPAERLLKSIDDALKDGMD